MPKARLTLGKKYIRLFLTNIKSTKKVLLNLYAHVKFATVKIQQNTQRNTLNLYANPTFATLTNVTRTSAPLTRKTPKIVT